MFICVCFFFHLCSLSYSVRNQRRRPGRRYCRPLVPSPRCLWDLRRRPGRRYCQPLVPPPPLSPSVSPGPEMSPRQEVLPTPGPTSSSAVSFSVSGTRDVAPARGNADPCSHLLRCLLQSLRDQRRRPGSRYYRPLVLPPRWLLHCLRDQGRRPVRRYCPPLVPPSRCLLQCLRDQRRRPGSRYCRILVPPLPLFPGPETSPRQEVLPIPGPTSSAVSFGVSGTIETSPRLKVLSTRGPTSSAVSETRDVAPAGGIAVTWSHLLLLRCLRDQRCHPGRRYCRPLVAPPPPLSPSVSPGPETSPRQEVLPIPGPTSSSSAVRRRPGRRYCRPLVPPPPPLSPSASSGPEDENGWNLFI